MKCFRRGEHEAFTFLCNPALGIKPGSIAIDTTSQGMGGADENGAGMAQLVVNATTLVNYFGCLVGLIHHVPLADDELGTDRDTLFKSVPHRAPCGKDRGSKMYVLITGTLHRDPISRTGKTGAPFVTANLRYRSGQEIGWASVIAFAEDARTELLRLREDDTLSVQGEGRLSTYRFLPCEIRELETPRIGQ